jgi:site-specific DNA recombinase
MKIADLYIRVSTDEQADKGYSQRDQEERLRKYCNYNSIQIRHTIFEDHSAKTFKRPAWQNLLAILRKQQGKTNLILFTKWDRFSRNAGDAYQMINILKHLNIEPQAIEQPLDISIPENKIMLAVYLASPEVENDRRALNTFNGMRRAKKEGRWMGSAPTGYLNKISEDGRKYISIDPIIGPIVKDALEEISKGNFTVSDVFRKGRKKGLSCTLNHFWKVIHNPVYCGKIFVPAYKDEQAYFAEGKHEPLISATIFHKIQDIVNGKKSASRTSILVDDNIPLRGFLLCPNCGYNLTASASKSKTGRYYHYYHCNSKCGVRYRAEHVNELFVQKLAEYTANPAATEVFRKKITLAFSSPVKTNKSEIQQLNGRVSEAQEKIKKARESFLNGVFDEVDFKTIKAENEKKVNQLEDRIFELLNSKDDTDYNLLIDSVLRLMLRPKEYYNFIDSEGKRDLISSMFPEKITFDGTEHRTQRVNEIVALIYQTNKKLQNKRTRLNEKKSRQPREVTQLRLF